MMLPRLPSALLPAQIISCTTSLDLVELHTDGGAELA